MNKTNNFASFLTNGFNMRVPRKLTSKPHTQKFGRVHALNRKAIKGEVEIRKRVVFGRYDHHFGFGGIGSEVVIGKPCIDDVDV